MRNPLKMNDYQTRTPFAGAAAVSLALTLAAFGCTSNKMAGNSQPTTVTPTVGPAATASAPGVSGGTTPMISSGPAAMIDPAVDAQAAMAARQNRGGRVLGTSDPGPGTIAGAALPPTGQFVAPAVAIGGPTVTPMVPAAPSLVVGPFDAAGGVAIAPGVSGGITAASNAGGTIALAAPSVVPPLAVLSTTAPPPTTGSLTIPPPTGRLSPAIPAGTVHVATASDGSVLVTNSAQQKGSITQRVRRFFGRSAPAPAAPKQ